MELSKGICFFCSNKKVVSDSTAKLFKKIKSLFNDSSINYEELKRITPPKACPVCYHKINTLKTINEDTHSDSDNCLLCGNHQDIIRITKWNVFDEISSDFSTLTKNRIPKICTACIFYLDIRNLVKEKLLSTYPFLKAPRKSSSKFESNIINHSTPFIEKRMRKTRTPSTVCIDLTEDEVITSFKPLKHQKEFNLNNSVHEDYKFMNQVLIIKLHTLENGEFINNNNKNKEQIVTNKKYNNANKMVNSKSLKTKSIDKEKPKKKKIKNNNEDSDDALYDPLKKKSYYKIKLKNKPDKKGTVKKFKPAQNKLLKDLKKNQLIINLERIEVSKPICIEENILNGISIEHMEPLDEKDPLEIGNDEIMETETANTKNSKFQEDETSDSEHSTGVEESVISLIKDIDNDLADSENKENATIKQLAPEEQNEINNLDKNGKDLETEVDSDETEKNEEDDEEIIVGDDSIENEKEINPENLEDTGDNGSEIKEAPVLEDNDSQEVNKQNGDIEKDVDKAAEQSDEDVSVSREDVEVSQEDTEVSQEYSEACQENIEKSREDSEACQENTEKSLEDSEACQENTEKSLEVSDVSQRDTEVSQEESENSDGEDFQKNTASNKELDLSSDMSEIVDGTASLEIQSEKIETVILDTSVDSQEEDDFVTGKRKRSDSCSEVNTSERKKKKVTFSEDTMSKD